MNVARHDADLDFIGSDHARAVWANQNGFTTFTAHALTYFHHVANWNTFSDTNHEVQVCFHRFPNCSSSARFIAANTRHALYRQYRGQFAADRARPDALRIAALDALAREESCGGHFREEYQHPALSAFDRMVNGLNRLPRPLLAFGTLGLFIYAMVVARFKSFSAYAGILALALIVIPVVIRTTENMLSLIPNALREAAYALGTPKWKVILSITLKASRAGVITGILLAVARIAGETAPLLFTALSNQFWTSDLREPMASLPVTIFKFAMSPYENWQKLAWAGVFLITLGVLALNIIARVLFRQR